MHTPSKGGSYVVDKKGKLKCVEQTLPAQIRSPNPELGSDTKPADQPHRSQAATGTPVPPSRSVGRQASRASAKNEETKS